MNQLELSGVIDPRAERWTLTIDRADSYKLHYVDSYKTRAQAESMVYRILKTTRESCYISESADLDGVKLADVWAREQTDSEI